MRHLFIGRAAGFPITAQRLGSALRSSRPSAIPRCVMSSLSTHVLAEVFPFCHQQFLGQCLPSSNKPIVTNIDSTRAEMVPLTSPLMYFARQGSTSCTCRYPPVHQTDRRITWPGISWMNSSPRPLLVGTFPGAPTLVIYARCPDAGHQHQRSHYRNADRRTDESS